MSNVGTFSFQYKNSTVVLIERSVGFEYIFTFTQSYETQLQKSILDY